MIAGVLATLRLPLAAALAALAVACTSGPPPVDDRPYDAHVQAYRQQKDHDFRAAGDSPIPTAERASFPGLPYFPIDPAYRVPAALTEDTFGKPLVIELQTSTSAVRRERKVGSLGFSIGGQAYTLTAFVDDESPDVRHLFVPFTDLTSGTDTYAHGRYLDLDRTPTGLYDLDFNRAYHPFCVYNSAYECPVPPKENRLPIAIRAGERLK
jgi:hypothetical protein